MSKYVTYNSLVIAFQGQIPVSYPDDLRRWIKEQGWVVRSVREKKVADAQPTNKARLAARRKELWELKKKNKPEKYKPRVPKIVKDFILSLEPGDRLYLYKYEVPQVQLIRGSEIVYCEYSLYEYLRDHKLIIKGVRGQFIEDWLFGPKLRNKKAIREHFRWVLNPSKARSEKMSVYRRNGRIKPGHEKKIKNPLPPVA